MSDIDLKTFAIFDTDNGYTHTIQYVAQGEDEQDAFSTFDEDLLSDTGEEAGWDWHVYEIPSDDLTDDEIYEYVDDRRPVTITS